MTTHSDEQHTFILLTALLLAPLAALHAADPAAGQAADPWRGSSGRYDGKDRRRSSRRPKKR